METQDPFAVGYTKFRVPLHIPEDIFLAVSTFHDAICQVADSGSYHYRFDDQGQLIRLPPPYDIAVIDQGPKWTFEQIRDLLLELQLFPDPPQYTLDNLPPFKLQIEPIREQTRLSLKSQFQNWFRLLFDSSDDEFESWKYINSLKESGQRRQHEIGWNFEQLSNWYFNQWSAGEAKSAIGEWYVNRK